MSLNISVVAAKIWYPKNVRFLLGHPVYIQIIHHKSCHKQQIKNS